MKKYPIIAIVGPTASGKTGLALELARKYGGEIISADSRQVYRGMDIGTAKEVADDIPHHLIDIVNPDEDFTLAHFLQRANETIEDIRSRRRLPIVVGGTGLYVQALVENWQVPDVAPNPTLREELEKKSAVQLHDDLAKIDPQHAQELGLGKRYLIRALEVFDATGNKPSDLKQKQGLREDVIVLGVDISREVLKKRIYKRVDQMFDSGLVGEVEELAKKYPKELKAFRTIGYQEFVDGNEKNVVQIKQEIKNHTWQYAKRQLTWLKRMKYVRWCSNSSLAIKYLTKVL